ncbi:MAG: NAD-dependent epimerase/dehydratase family protein [Patescibacteria group bacterium]
MIPQIIKKIIDDQKMGQGFIRIWGSGNSKRDFLYAEDAAEWILLATERYDKPEPVNIGSGTDIAIRELVKKLCDVMDYRGEIRFDSSRPDGQLRRLLDVARAEREFGFRAVRVLTRDLRKQLSALERRISRLST